MCIYAFTGICNKKFIINIEKFPVVIILFSHQNIFYDSVDILLLA